MGKQIERQRLRLVKRFVLTPISGVTRRWALSGAASASKRFALRHVVLPGLAASRRPFERHVGSDLVFRGNSEDFLPVMILIFGTWEPVLTEFLRRRLTQGRVFVDVGANLGWFALVASRCVGPSGSVVAIEASPSLFERLQAQVDRNHLENVRAVNQAVGASSGWAHIQAGPSAHTGLTRVVPANSTAPDEVVVSTLPSILTEQELSRCRAIKIDVEGSEYNVIRGMQNMLSVLPADAEIVVEVGPERAILPNDVAELFETFRAHGYHAYTLPNVYSVSAYRDPHYPAALERLRHLPDRETDVVFSRTDEDRLPF